MSANLDNIEFRAALECVASNSILHVVAKRHDEQKAALADILNELSEALCHMDAMHPAFPYVRKAQQMAKARAQS